MNSVCYHTVPLGSPAMQILVRVAIDDMGRGRGRHRGLQKLPLGFAMDLVKMNTV